MLIEQQIGPLRTINCILLPDWENATAADLSRVLQPLWAHPAKSEIAILIDSRTLSADWQESANLLIYEAILEAEAAKAIEAAEAIEAPEAPNIVLTGAITPQDWLTIRPLLNFRMPIACEDLQLVAQPEIAVLPTVSPSELVEPAVYEAAQQQSWGRWGDYFAAQGELQQQYGQFLHQIMAASYPQWSKPRPMPPLGQGTRIRVGYLSSFLCSWSGTVLFLNWLKYADLAEFEIYAYHIGDQVDAVTEQFRAYSSQFHHIQLRSQPDFERVCQQVTADNLHLLIFPELGMFGRTLCLAALRLAPVQCMAWGQPVTSGIPTVDYFLSSQTMEPENGQAHYSEKLVRLPGVGISYPTIRVQHVQRQRAAFGLRQDAVVYLSSQAPYKYLPQHDWLYAQIARQVPNAQFMFLRAGISPERLARAFASLGLDSQDYCLVSPVLPRPDYSDLISLSDIYLDTPEWSGGNTTLDALACHLPVVTYPGEFMRGRHSSGFLQTMGVTTTLAADAAEYVEIAVRLADPAQRQPVRDGLRQAVPMLFDNPTATRNLEAFLKQAATLVE